MKKMTFIKQLLIFCGISVSTALIFAGCGSSGGYVKSGEESSFRYDSSTESISSEPSAEYVEESADGKYAANTGSVDSVIAANEKLIIRNNLNIQTKSFDDYIKGLEALVNKGDAYIEGQSIYNGSIEGDELKTASYTVRVKKEAAGSFSKGLEALAGKITSNSRQVENVTQSYRDLERRIALNKAKEERLTALLEKAEKVEDLIELEKEIATLMTDREYMQTDMISLDHSVSYDYYYLEIVEVREYVPIKEDKSFVSDLRYQFNESISSFVRFLQNIVLALAYLWIWIALLLVIILIIITCAKAGRKKRLKKMAAVQNMQGFSPNGYVAGSTANPYAGEMYNGAGYNEAPTEQTADKGTEVDAAGGNKDTKG